MGIKNLVDNIRELYKYKKEGRRLHSLCKPVELMNDEEVLYELSYLAGKNRDATLLDNRTVDLLKEIFSYGEGTSHGLENALSYVSFFSQESVKKQVLDIYANLKILPQEYIESDFYKQMYFERSKEEIHEERLNYLKSSINNFTDKITRPFRQVNNKQSLAKSSEIGTFRAPVRYKKNPFELKKSTKKKDEKHEENKRIELYIKSQFFIKNMEQFDLDTFFEHYKYNREMIESVFNLLSDDRKTSFCSMFLSSEAFKSCNVSLSNEYIDLFKNYISQDELIDFYMSNDLEEAQGIIITDEKILDYYLKHNGFASSRYTERLNSIIKKLSLSEVQGLLEKNNNPENHSRLELVYQLNDEEYDCVLKNENISPAIKESIFRIKISKLSDEDKLALYKDLTSEQQIKFINTFLFSNDAEKQFITSFISDTKDEELKRLLTIKYNTKDKISIDEVIYYINHCKEYNLYIDINKIKDYTDSEIEEIYERIDNEDLKANLLQLNRQINPYTSNMTDEEVKKFNESQPNSILVNKKNLKKFFSTAKSACCYSVLTHSEEINYLSFSEIYEILNDFLGKKGFLIENKFYKISEVEKRLINLASQKANLKEKYFLFEKGFLNKARMLDSINYYNFDSQKIFEELTFIESISDIEIKKKFLQELNGNLINKPTFVLSKQEKISVEEENKRNYSILNKVYKEKILDKNISTENKYLYLSVLLRNYYNKEMNNLNKKVVLEKALEIQELFSLINNETQKQDYDFIFNFKPQYVEGFFRRKIG